MNVLFFITPKSEVAYLYEDYSLRQALEKMEHYRYSAIPIIDRNGCYIGTMTEGDFLWYIKDHNIIDLKETEKDIQDLTDKYIKEIDNISAAKEKEILEV